MTEKIVGEESALIPQGVGRFQVTGHSMRYFLREGDAVKFEKTSAGKLRLGDVVLLLCPQKENKPRCVVHRLLWKWRQGDQWRIWSAGDWVVQRDTADSLYVGRLLEIERNGIRIAWSGRVAWVLGLCFFAYSRVFLLAFSVAGVFKKFVLLPIFQRTARRRGLVALFLRGMVFQSIPVLDKLGHRIFWSAGVAADGLMAFYISFLMPRTSPDRSDLT